MLSSLFKLIPRRLTYLLVVLLCFGSVGYALYSQYFQGAEPCPLCIAQRVIYAIIGVIALIALFNNCKGWGNLIYGILLLGVSLFGVKVAHHHVWLQSLPPDQWPSSCGMPLSVLYSRVPLSGFLHTVLSGTAECAAVNWKVFGFSGPLVSMYAYILCAIAAIYIIIYRTPRRSPYYYN